ncbi:hypothetical protein SEEH3711_13668 [Salmonella enterica subsp. enterica serovar Heidelberg str. 622737-11]|nr:hypothetical protein SEEH3711_13668 [Salmonella enterica subsp. enterica serovar Heidelberg str. 622737-11]KJT85805.1 hypothetical protein SEEH0300_25654 [Salmonella enterica subsp. enterica serovar Heidelberg str. 76-0300]KJU00935.1 hypothetical protein SEEH1831_17088 [Salmonella enterica subsp. enterica serovar Heidelberg str. 77-1831]KJU24791.1 hypothetical protein SEEH1068_06828 [Salmonella enterica subsp. enterica serovar Heidelberg str. 83-1068]KJU35548.1 hypothetical protein SEEH0312_
MAIVLFQQDNMVLRDGTNRRVFTGEIFLTVVLSSVIFQPLQQWSRQAEPEQEKRVTKAGSVTVISFITQAPELKKAAFAALIVYHVSVNQSPD